MNPRLLLRISAAAGCAAVALGAFGAHALAPRLAELGTSETWKTAVLYQMTHALALMALALSGRKQAMAASCWLGGTILFSGSLFFLALDGPRWLGPVTPLGGVLLIAGWLALAIKPPRGPA